MKKSVKNLLVVSALTFATVAFADSPKGTELRLDQKLEVGATTLEPGVYRIKVLPGTHRNELVLTSEDGSKTFATVLAIPQKMVTSEQREKQFVYYPSADGSGRSLRTWYAPDAASGGGYDIVYPTKRATELAVMAKHPVVAYRSETTSSEWTTAELQVVGADKKVTVYKESGEQGDSMAMTHGEDRSELDRSYDQDKAANLDRGAVPADKMAARNEVVDTRYRELPQTASRLPLIALLGALLLLAAGGLRYFRV